MEMTQKQTNLREGYVKTKLGIIPKDWSTPTLPEVFTFLRNTSFSRSQMNYEKEIGVHCIHYGDIHATYQRPILDFDNDSLIPKINNNVELPSNIDLLKDGDLIIADASEDYDGIGTAIELTNINGKEVLSGLHTFALRDYKGKTVKGFRTYIFKNPLVKNALKTIATGSKVYGISKGNLEKFRIVLPTIAEQQKIAKILSTWDIAIATQEQLIQAKETFKKGLMQVLLTGKKRFDGFEEDWKKLKLNNVVDFKNGKAHEQNITSNGDYIVVNSKFISTNGVVRKHTDSQRAPLFENDIVMVMSDVPNGKALAKCYLIEKNSKYSLNQRICSLTSKGVNHTFLLNQINRNKYYLKFNDGIGQTNLKKNEVLACPIFLPSQVEQNKISDTLIIVDREIKFLKLKLVQLQEQKQGLMQLLLTGEVRVKTTEV
jgi:type I restriction enzyme S subunit